MWHEIFFPAVRKRRAPNGALRLTLVDHIEDAVGAVRRHRAPPNIACNSLSSELNERRKQQNCNLPTSNLEGVEAELHATFSNNPERSAP